MLKKTITYEDYNGKTVTEDFYFNLTQAELIEMELNEKGGLAAMLKRIVESEDGAKIIATFKSIILRAYGVKSEDGRRFVKSQELCDEFAQTPAYSVLFMELATDANTAAEFVKGIVPTAGIAPDALDGVISGIAPPKIVPLEAPAPEKPMREMTREELLHALSLKDGEAAEEQ